MRLFFYGTLMAGSSNPVAGAVHRRLGPGRAARVRGSLYAIPDPLGWYPALLPGPGLVDGMLHEATDAFTSADLAMLDAYEGYDPARLDRSEYVRRSVVVLSASGEIEAQVYAYNAPLPPADAVALPHGDFVRFLTEKGAWPFGALPPPL